ncbi:MULTISPECIES: hypothetical protein [unclassified Actinotignum]|uniref:hypothetical protein n=1 Tax=unclassified Actinotignum TaxID=2632702 RepID=UPI002A81D31F|nr:hypothetical protein [Actinotignum sp. SLA_B059]MDY5127468.1 hypothetical protein [Actinotignum sp. SLA_B059]
MRNPLRDGELGTAARFNGLFEEQEEAINALKPGSWVSVPATWGGITSSLKVRKIPGLVIITGGINSTRGNYIGKGETNNILKLPSGFRPSGEIILPGAVFHGAATPRFLAGAVWRIDSSGNISLSWLPPGAEQVNTAYFNAVFPSND